MECLLSKYNWLQNASNNKNILNIFTLILFTVHSTSTAFDNILYISLASKKTPKPVKKYNNDKFNADYPKNCICIYPSFKKIFFFLTENFKDAIKSAFASFVINASIGNGFIICMAIKKMALW